MFQLKHLHVNLLVTLKIKLEHNAQIKMLITMMKSVVLEQFHTPNHYSLTYHRFSSYDENENICVNFIADSVQRKFANVTV